MSKYKKLLRASLERANMNQDGIKAVLVKFEFESARTGDEQTTFEKMVDEYSNESVATASLLRLPERSPLESELERISTENKHTILPPGDVLKNYVARMKRDTGKLDCEIVLSEQEQANMPDHLRRAYEKADTERRAGFNLDVPSCFFSSSASYHGQDVPMSVEFKVTRAP